MRPRPFEPDPDNTGEGMVRRYATNRTKPPSSPGVIFL